jgi:hypothetical protein
VTRDARLDDVCQTGGRPRQVWQVLADPGCWSPTCPAKGAGRLGPARYDVQEPPSQAELAEMQLNTAARRLGY